MARHRRPGVGRKPPTPGRAGPRIRLAVPSRADEAGLLALGRLSRAFLRGRASVPSTRQGFARYLARCRGDGFAGLLIRRRSDGAILGLIEISQISRGNFQSAYLGYLIGAPFANQGYMSEALALAVGHAFTRLRLHRLEANIQPSNAASIALVRRLGFTREGYSKRYLKIGGRWRDHERWAILHEDWRRRR